MFRCESISLNTHWVLVVMDHFTRRIIGFGVHAGDVNGVALCRMFNTAISTKVVPKYLSSDNDYQERKIKPRCFDNVTRFMLMLLSHGFAWQDALANVTPKTFIG